MGLVPSQGSGSLPLDADLNAIFKITDKDEQVLAVDTFNGSYWSREIYDLSGLTCEDGE